MKWFGVFFDHIFQANYFSLSFSIISLLSLQIEKFGASETDAKSLESFL